jgi:hypothetical protein
MSCDHHPPLRDVTANTENTKILQAKLFNAFLFRFQANFYLPIYNYSLSIAMRPKTGAVDYLLYIL